MEDIASTDGDPLPEVAAASGDPGKKTDALRSAILKQGIAIGTADDLGGALGTSTRARIQILNGLSPAETFLVLAHSLPPLMCFTWLCFVGRRADGVASGHRRSLVT